MQIEVGQIVEGKVTGITNFGVFVDLGEGKTGLVHISEIAQAYVSDVKEFVKENDTVKMKVLNISEDGKISLSIKRAQEQHTAIPISEAQLPERNHKHIAIIIEPVDAAILNPADILKLFSAPWMLLCNRTGDHKPCSYCNQQDHSNPISLSHKQTF